MCRSLNHLVGESEHFVGNGEAERLGGFEIDGEIEFGRLLDRLAGFVPRRILSTTRRRAETDQESLRRMSLIARDSTPWFALLAAGAWLFGVTAVLIWFWR
jgi:hypothetical protein